MPFGPHLLRPSPQLSGDPDRGRVAPGRGGATGQLAGPRPRRRADRLASKRPGTGPGRRSRLHRATHHLKLRTERVPVPTAPSRVICRFYFGSRHLFVSVPLPTDRVQQLAPSFVVTLPEKGWAGMALNAVSDLEKLGDVLAAAYEQQRNIHINIYNYND